MPAVRATCEPCRLRRVKCDLREGRSECTNCVKRELKCPGVGVVATRKRRRGAVVDQVELEYGQPSSSALHSGAPSPVSDATISIAASPHAFEDLTALDEIGPTLFGGPVASSLITLTHPSEQQLVRLELQSELTMSILSSFSLSHGMIFKQISPKLYQRIFSQAGGRLDALDPAQEVMLRVMLTLGARTSMHPEILPGADFSSPHTLGIIREGPCRQLAQVALRRYDQLGLWRQCSLTAVQTSVTMFLISSTLFNPRLCQPIASTAVSLFRQYLSQNPILPSLSTNPLNPQRSYDTYTPYVAPFTTAPEPISPTFAASSSPDDAGIFSTQPISGESPESSDPPRVGTFNGLQGEHEVQLMNTGVLVLWVDARNAADNGDRPQLTEDDLDDFPALKEWLHQPLDCPERNPYVAIGLPLRMHLHANQVRILRSFAGKFHRPIRRNDLSALDYLPTLWAEIRAFGIQADHELEQILPSVLECASGLVPVDPEEENRRMLYFNNIVQVSGSNCYISLSIYELLQKAVARTGQVEYLWPLLDALGEAKRQLKRVARLVESIQKLGSGPAIWIHLVRLFVNLEAMPSWTQLLSRSDPNSAATLTEEECDLLTEGVRLAGFGAGFAPIRWLDAMRARGIDIK